MARFLRRQVTYALRPPVAFPPAATALPQPVQTHLSRAPRSRSRSRSRLSAPAVVFSAYTPFGPATKQVPHPRQARQSRYLLHPPATLVPAVQPFLAQAPKAVYATATRRSSLRPSVTSSLAPPEVVDPSSGITPLPPVPGITRKLVSIRRAVEQHVVTSYLFPPEVVDPIPAAPGAARKLVRSPRQGRTVQTKLFPPATLAPAVVLPPFRATQTIYGTATRRAVQRHQQGKRLSAPTVVSPAISGDNPVGSVFDPNYFLLIHP